MSLLVEEPKILNELREWYETTWTNADSLTDAKIDSTLKRLPEDSSSRESGLPMRTSSFEKKKIRSRLPIRSRSGIQQRSKKKRSPKNLKQQGRKLTEGTVLTVPEKQLFGKNAGQKHLLPLRKQLVKAAERYAPLPKARIAKSHISDSELAKLNLLRRVERAFEHFGTLDIEQLKLIVDSPNFRDVIDFLEDEGAIVKVTLSPLSRSRAFEFIRKAKKKFYKVPFKTKRGSK